MVNVFRWSAPVAQMGGGDPHFVMGSVWRWPGQNGVIRLSVP
jgi:hypothetical protein